MITEKRRAWRREYQRRIFARRRAAGICVHCGKEPAAENRTCCEACLAKVRERQGRMRERRRAAGVCVICETPVTDGKVRCPDCRGDQQTAKRARRLR